MSEFSKKKLKHFSTLTTKPAFHVKAPKKKLLVFEFALNFLGNSFLWSGEGILVILVWTHQGGGGGGLMNDRDSLSNIVVW